jgi:hypothetical protein
MYKTLIGMSVGLGSLSRIGLKISTAIKRLTILLDHGALAARIKCGGMSKECEDSMASLLTSLQQHTFFQRTINAGK